MNVYLFIDIKMAFTKCAQLHSYTIILHKLQMLIYGLLNNNFFSYLIRECLYKNETTK